ncbi:3-hydroxyacyl-ACP dehydratase FabZ [Pasteurellaceae bacterium LIM206]|nr:3-hydroxyacyl-ACP dehydratase FabZ [Pasteurellaceae bacterium LIM206]
MTAENSTSRVIEVNEIMKLLPHRYPFLLVDRVLDYKEGEWLKAIKNVSVNEPQFTGHFPHEPILPGVLILEALAQSMGILAFKTHELRGGELFYYAGIDEVRFKKPVVPGDQMEMYVEVIKERRGITRFKAVASVDGEVVCEGTLMCARK